METNPYIETVIVELTIAEIDAIVARCNGDYRSMSSHERFLLRNAVKRLTKRALRQVGRRA